MADTMLALPSGERPRPRNLLPIGLALAGIGGTLGFGALMAAWLNVRNFNKPWPPTGVRLVNYTGSMLAVTAGMALVTSAWSLWALHRDLRGQAAAGFGFSIGLSLAFVNLLWFFGKNLDIAANSSAFATIVFATLACSGVVSAIGVVAFVAALIRVVTRQDRQTTLEAAAAVTIYWGFVTVSWLIVVLVAYMPLAF